MTAALAHAVSAPGQIGPNAVLQLMPLLRRELGEDGADDLMRLAGMSRAPSDQGLMSEQPAAALHQALRRTHPDVAVPLLSEAGQRTADYILAHRIPGPAKLLLKMLPGVVAGPILLRAIQQHAWTFAGSGEFTVVQTRPAIVTLHNNPLIAGETAKGPICHWHSAVFARLFSVLVATESTCREVQCQAEGAPCCCFEIG